MTRIMKRIVNLPFLFASLKKSSKCRKGLLLVFVVSFMALCGFGTFKAIAMSYDAVENKIVQTLDWRIQNIDVRVTEKSSAVDITEAMDKNGLREGIFVNKVSWKALKKDLDQNPLIKTALIMRPSADKVSIVIEPSNIIARVNEREWHDIDKELRHQQSVLIDQSGQKIRVTPRAKDKALIGISGHMVMDHVDQFWGLLMAEPSIASATGKVEFIGQRRWDITLTNGVKVKLPEREIGLALSRLSKMINDRMVDMASIKIIDLRTNDRAFVEYKKEDQGVSDAAQG